MKWSSIPTLCNGYNYFSMLGLVPCLHIQASSSGSLTFNRNNSAAYMNPFRGNYTKMQICIHNFELTSVEKVLQAIPNLFQLTNTCRQSPLPCHSSTTIKSTKHHKLFSVVLQQSVTVSMWRYHNWWKTPPEWRLTKHCQGQVCFQWPHLDPAPIIRRMAPPLPELVMRSVPSPMRNQSCNQWYHHYHHHHHHYHHHHHWQYHSTSLAAFHRFSLVSINKNRRATL